MRMTKIAIVAALLAASAAGQSPSIAVQSVQVNNITSSATVIDNRSSKSRQSTFYSFFCIGTGTWSVQMQYSADNSSWTNFAETTALITNTSGTSIGSGSAYPYRNYIRFVVTGSVSVNYTGGRYLFIPSVISGGGGGGSAIWGTITGTLSDQTDLNTALGLKQATSAKGAANGYASLDSNALVPTSQLPSFASSWGTIGGTLSNQTDLATALALKAPIAGPTFTGTVTSGGGGHFAGNITGNVTGNVAGNVTGAVTGNVTGNVSGTAATFTGNLTGDVTSTGMATTLSNSGVSAGSCGDATHSCSITVDAKGRVTVQTNNSITSPGTGDVSSTTSSTTDSIISLFSGTGGKTIKPASGTGLVKATAGVASYVAAPTGVVVGDTDTQTLTNKTLTAPIVNSPTIGGSMTAAAATQTIPMKTGTSLPGTCTIGATYFKTDATAGQNIYECASTNTWTQQLNSGGGGGAPSGASYLTLGLDGGLSAERVLTAGAGINFTDLGANSTLTVAFDSSVLAGSWAALATDNTYAAGATQTHTPSATKFGEVMGSGIPSLNTANGRFCDNTSGCGWANGVAKGKFANPATVDRTWTMQDASYTVIGRDTTDTLTNKTLDTEGTGNVVTASFKYTLNSATCDSATPISIYSNPTASGGAAACYGTNPQKFGAMDYADTGTALTSTDHIELPADWTGTIDAKFIWFSGSTSTNSAVWTLATKCLADGDALLSPTFNATQTAADPNNAVASTRNSVSITGVTTTGCAAGSTMYLRIGRDSSNGSDTLAATASLIAVELTIRRAL